MRTCVLTATVIIGPFLMFPISSALVFILGILAYYGAGENGGVTWFINLLMAGLLLWGLRRVLGKLKSRSTQSVSFKGLILDVCLTLIGVIMVTMAFMYVKALWALGSYLLVP